MFIVLMDMFFKMQQEIIEHVVVLYTAIRDFPQHKCVDGVALHDTVKQFFNLFAFPHELSLNGREQIFATCYIRRYC